MEIYNTLTRKKETFVPMEEGKVKMYCCGPTVYNFIHIGNARPICLFDVFRRYLEFRGYHVTFVQNFTDVDDKIIKKANEEGVTAAEIAQRYIKEYETDAKGLGVRPATVHPTVTGHIPDIIDIIQTLIDKGHAYQAGGRCVLPHPEFPGIRQAQPHAHRRVGKRRSHCGGRTERRSPGLCPLESRKARRTLLGFPLGTGPSWLAH